MRYQVKFREDALKEWQKLDKTIQQQFAKKLKKCCDNPHIPSAKLRGIKDCYKIKLRASGLRLVYQVIDEPRQPGGCKLKTAPVRPVVAARPAE
ncbi:type II toxin-antitoxin system RelE family toxin, partial [Escherichia coli]|uniref:type II toxin-antitoxin system RelE family toxin n=1 Tax=Escherichia coli TaxID=562 RepID=UPI001FCD026A